MSSEKILIPSSAEEVTSAWLSQILHENISTNGFVLIPDVHAGSGFLSNMIRVACENEDGSKRYKLIIKLLPAEGPMRDLVLSEKFDKSEINFYLTSVPDLIQELPQLSSFFCPVHFGEIQEAQPEKNIPYASVLVLEDLGPQGYYTINFADEESPEQLKAGVEFLAQLHFAGMAVTARKKSTFAELYPFLQNLNIESPSAFYEMAKAGFEDFDAVLADHGGMPATREAYKNLAPYSNDIINLVRDKRKNAVLVHGDLWSNNILFNADPDKQMKIIDWQLVGYNDPAIDLAVMIVASLPKDKLNPEQVQILLNIYCDTFEDLCQRSHEMDTVVRSREEFSKFFYTYGLTYVFLWFAMAVEPFSLNFPRLVRVFEFLHTDMKITEFMLRSVTQGKSD